MEAHGRDHPRIANRRKAIYLPDEFGARLSSWQMDAPAPARFRIALHRWHGSYFARAVDIPGCISRGATEVEAVENARAAIRAYILIGRALADERATVELEISA